MEYVPTIGLEIHIQLKTRTKMFCDSLNDPFESHPNINICPVCMGHPGTLPVPNHEAIKQTLRVGLAMQCSIASQSKFDRKNYFYPDLPKGYQISQYDMPFCSGGHINIELPQDHGEEVKRIDIERIHLEEDTGRLAHFLKDEEISGLSDKRRNSKNRIGDDGKYSFVDFNRAGIPLMELVTRPVIQNALEARKFVEQVRLIVRYLGASDANMEKGQMRVEVNMSLAKEGAKKLGTKVELKNLNSLRAVEEATVYEIKRQKALLKNGKKITQETRGWDENKKQTFSQRKKEQAHDYRYFPEPDIPPLVISKEYGLDLEELQASIPELPQVKHARFIKEYDISKKDANIFIQEKELADYYEGVVSEAFEWDHDLVKSEDDKNKIMRLAANYTVKNLRTLLQEHEMPVRELKITQENFGEFIGLIYKGEISSSAARQVLEIMFDAGRDPSDIMEESGLRQVSSAKDLEVIINKVVKENEQAVRDYRNGKEESLQFLVGKVMAISRGAANPEVAREMLKKKLSI